MSAGVPQVVPPGVVVAGDRLAVVERELAHAVAAFTVGAGQHVDLPADAVQAPPLPEEVIIEDDGRRVGSQDGQGGVKTDLTILQGTSRLLDRDAAMRSMRMVNLMPQFFHESSFVDVGWLCRGSSRYSYLNMSVIIFLIDNTVNCF